MNLSSDAQDVGKTRSNRGAEEGKRNPRSGKRGEAGFRESKRGRGSHESRLRSDYDTRVIYAFAWNSVHYFWVEGQRCDRGENEKLRAE